MKKFALLIVLSAIIGVSYLFFEKTQKRVVIEFDIHKELKKRANKEFLEQEIKKELEKKNLEEAEALIDLGSYLDVDINKTLIQAFYDKKDSLGHYFDTSKEFLNGFFSGEIKNSASLAGAISSDFTVVGDIRDIYKEGSNYLESKPYDSFILSLSLIGLSLSASTFISLGSTTPLKVASSTLKAAKRGKYLSKNFAKLLEKKLQESVKLSNLKQIDLSSFRAIKKSSQKIAKGINLTPIKSTLSQIHHIKKYTSSVDTLKILRFVDNEKELHKAVLITKRYKKHSYGVFKVLGKKAFQGAKVIIKKTPLYFFNLILFVFSVIVWFIIFMSFLWRLVR